MSTQSWYVGLVAARGRRARLVELVGQRTQPPLVAGPGRRRVRRGPLPGDGGCCTPACWSAAVVEVLVAGPAVPALAGLADARLWSPRTGAALVVHRARSGRSGTPGSSWCPACRWCTGGPYRFLRHPNYVAVVVEGIALPLVHTAWLTAVVFTVLTPLLLRVRIRGRGTRRSPAAAGVTGATSTCWSPAAGRSGWPPPSGPARAGLSVAVVEPRDDAGRQGLRRGADAGAPSRALADLGVDRRPGGRSPASATWRRAVARGARFRAGPGLGVRRTTLHAALRRPRPSGVGVDRVRGSGSAGRAGRATGSRRRGSGRAGWWPPTACTRRCAGRSAWTAPAPRRPAATGCAGTSRSRPGRDLVEVHWAEHAEAYVTPVGDGPGRRRRAAAPRRARRTTRRWPASRPCCARLRGAEPVTAVLGARVRCARSARSPSPGGCCWSATPRATSTRSPARAWRSGWPRRRGGGSGRCRAPAGLPVGLAAGDPALPVVGDRPAGRDGPARSCAAAWSRWPRPHPPSSGAPSTR